jgi:hypothetical protein
MKKFVAVAAIAALVVSSSVASAAGLAEVTSSSGKVLVNQGKGYTPVSGLLSLKAGDLLMTGEGAQAQISYADGCIVTAQENAMIAIAVKAPCLSGQKVSTDGVVFVQPTAVMGPSAFPAGMLPIVAIGAVVVGTGVLVATGAFKKSRKNCGVSAC